MMINQKPKSLAPPSNHHESSNTELNKHADADEIPIASNTTVDGLKSSSSSTRRRTTTTSALTSSKIFGQKEHVSESQPQQRYSKGKLIQKQAHIQ